MLSGGNPTFGALFYCLTYDPDIVTKILPWNYVTMKDVFEFLRIPQKSYFLSQLTFTMNVTGTKDVRVYLHTKNEVISTQTSMKVSYT